MRARLNAPKANGPKVIPLIPNLRLCYIEGRNGIGKTLAVRLLELATGGNPYLPIPAAWDTLREQLGPVTIDVDEVGNTSTLRFELIPASWPADPAALLTPSQLGDVYIDGKQGKWSDAAKRLRVIRIGGDETLRVAVANDLAIMARRARRFASAIRPRATTWDIALDSVSRALAGIDEQALLLAAKGQRDALAAAEAIEKDVSNNAQRLEVVAGLEEKVNAARELALRQSQIVESVKGQSDRLAVVQTAIQDLDRETILAASDAAKAALSKATKLRAGREKRLGDAIASERYWLRQLSLTGRPSSQERRSLRRELISTAADLKTKLDDLDLINPLVQMADEIETTVAPHLGVLSGQIIVTKPRLTLQGLSEGVHRRRTELSGQPRPAEVESLRGQLDVVREKSTALTQLNAAIENTLRKQELVERIDSEIASLLEAADEKRMRAYRKALARREELRAEEVDLKLSLSSLTGDISDLRAALGLPASEEAEPATDEEIKGAVGPDVQRATRQQGPRPETPLDETLLTYSSQLRAVKATLASQAKELAERHQAASERLSSATDQLIAIRTRIKAALDVISDSNSTFRRSADDVARSISGRSLRQLESSLASSNQPGFESRPVGEPERSAARLSSLAFEALERIAGAAQTALAAADAATGYLERQSIRVGQRSKESESGVEFPGESQLRGWVENRLSELFGAPELRRELFDGASRISFDLSDLVVRWQVEGRWTRRPLEAFSSGEQVFAYTRARLEDLGEQVEGVEHVVIVLDEFGAYVSRDRLSHLLQFVESEALGRMAHQAIVMLPLVKSVDADAQPLAEPMTLGQDEDRQVATWGYFVRDGSVGVPAP
jgi:hypothetical protein